MQSPPLTHLVGALTAAGVLGLDHEKSRCAAAPVSGTESRTACGGLLHEDCAYGAEKEGRPTSPLTSLRCAQRGVSDISSCETDLPA